MKILLLTHRLPYPPNRGDRIRSFHLLKFLAGHGDVSLACPTEEPIDDSARQMLAKICSQIEIAPISLIGRSSRAAGSLAAGRSATEGYFWNRQLANTISRWARTDKFDIVVCYCSGMYRYARLPALLGTPVVVDMVDVDSQKWRDCAERAPFLKRMLFQVESRRVGQLESEIAAHAAAITFVSEDERELFGKSKTSTPVQVVRNGVDLNYFAASPGQPPSEPNTCCFVGVLNYPPNVDGLHWFVESIWPNVRREVSNARLMIVGKSPGPRVQRLATAPGVELHANVPDVRPFLARSAVAIAPMRFARGIQNKILEAMAMEKAVVATPQSLEGICAQVGSDLLKACTAEDWSTTMCSLLASPTRAEQIGRAARRYVETHHCWDDCLRPLERHLLAQVPEQTRSSDFTPSPPYHPVPANELAT
jgi:sugar transferase (PEP-CTERM/EpsH1 system associated)